MATIYTANAAISNDETNNSSNNQILTDDQIKHVYDSLSMNNGDSVELLEQARKETENTQYNEITEIKIHNTDDSYEKTDLPKDILVNEFKKLNTGVSDDESESFAMLLLEYYRDRRIKVYDRLPKSIKSQVNRLLMTSYRSHYVTRESVSKMFLDGFINEAELNGAFEQFNTDIDAITADTNKGLEEIFSSGYSEMFDSIDEIREEDPEKADRIQKFKDMYDKAASFNTQLEYLKNDKPRNARKYHNMYYNTIYTFNNTVNSNSANIKIPDIEKIFDIIKANLPQYSNDQIKAFIVLLSKPVLMMNPEENATIVYAYWLVNSIYKYGFTKAMYDIEDRNKMFSAISKVIEAIEIHKSKRG